MKKIVKRYLKRNYIAFFWHGIFFAISAALIDLNTVLPGFIMHLSNSKLVLGLAMSILMGGPIIFQLLFIRIIDPLPYKKWTLLLGIYLRVLAFFGMFLTSLYLSISSPILAIYILFTLLLIFSVSGGFAGMSYMDIIGKITERKTRGEFFAIKQFLSALASIGAGLTVKKILNLSTLPFPKNYALLFLLACLALFMASIGFWLIKEPKAPPKKDKKNFKEYLKLIRKILKKDKNFLRFIIIENIAGLGIMIIPFYLAFAKDILKIREGEIGTYLTFQILGAILSNFFWGKVSKQIGSKKTLEICILIGSLLPILSIGIQRFIPRLFPLLFFGIGMVISGRQISFNTYILDIAPEEHRTVYVGINGSLVIFTMILPLIGGGLIEGFGYYTTFIIVSIGMFINYILTWGLKG